MSRLDQFSTRPPPENSTLGVLRHAQKASRAPMVNPYDKFTQPEFDAWIGDMTSSIRRALGFEQEEPHLFEKIPVNGGLPEYPQLDLSDQDEVQDDSFAQLKTRRDKGKARDPREGPGLGRDRTQPIEVVSSDEEEEDEVKALAVSRRVDDPDVYDQDEDAESDYLWERSSSNHIFSSPPIRIGPPLRSRKKSEVEESNADSDDNDEYEYDDGDFANQANDNSEAISISSDEDDSDEEDDYHNRPGPSSSRYPRDKEDEDEQLGEDADVDEVQPLDDDTSFPPHHSAPHRNLELNDPWEAPRKYAEDFYSGGELRLPAGAQVHPDHLNSLDDGIEEIEEDEELARSNQVNKTSSNLRSTSEFDQSYYSEDNVITSWDQQLDPHLFSCTKDVENDVDSFLTPGVLTPNQSELRTHLGETEDVVETGFRNELSLPNLPPVLPTKRNEPIPQDAEIIAIDDSDDDEEDSLVVVPPIDAILEMITEPAAVHPEEPEVSEKSQTNFCTPFDTVVDIYNHFGEDEILSIHTAHSEDIEHETRLQPLEIVEPEAADSNGAQENLAMTFDLQPVPSGVSDLELEKQDNPEIIEPEVMLLNAFDTLSSDAGPKSTTVEVDNQAPNYYEDFDDIYETPVPETLPPDSNKGEHLQPAGLVTLGESQTRAHEDTNLSPENIVSQGIETEGSQNTGEAMCPTEVRGSAEASRMGGQYPYFENNSVSSNDMVGSMIEESTLETRNGAISQISATPNGLRNDLPTLSSPTAEESLPKTPRFTTTLPVLLSPPRSSTVPGLPQIPMPVMADANVPDPTESPTRLQEHPILSIPGTPDLTTTSLQTPQDVEELVPTCSTLPFGPRLHLLNPNPNADGLFTPADFSIPTTPAESGVAMLPSEWHEADVTSSKTVTVDLQVQTELTDKPVASPKQAVGGIFTETDITSSGRKSVLMADPYPYCLSTPIGSVSDDGSSEEIDNSICSHSTAEKEKDETQFASPLAAGIGPHLNSQSATTEHEDAFFTLTEFDLQASTADTQDFLEDTAVEELSISLAQGEVDKLGVIELHDPLQPLVVEDSQAQATATVLQPSEAGVDIDLQTCVRENPEADPAEKKETKSTILEDSHPQASVEVENGAIPQATEAASRPSKRKRDTSPDGFSVKGKGRLHASSKGKQRGKDAETDVVDQPPECDTIYVRSRPSPKRRARDSTTSENPRSVDAGVSHLIDKTSKTEVGRPHPQFHAPSLFHAHGRTKRRKNHIQSIATVEQTRKAQHTSIVELPSSHSVPSRDPSPLDGSALPTTAGVISTEVRQSFPSPALPSAEPSNLSSTTAVPGVESCTQDDAMTSPLSSIVTADEISQATPSTPTTTVALQPTPSLQSSPNRFLQASNSASSIRSTRSQCKYHKITLPIEEKGLRVCFLVPGCSLANLELMEEEDIEDQGEATYEDSLRIIQHIDHLDFDPYLIGTLRQLVGLDILREGEVFYLPRPGDDVPRKHWPHKSNPERTPTGFAGSSGYSYSGSARSPSTRPPLSNADSVFTSLATTDGSDMGDNQSPSLGKRKSTTNGKTKGLISQPDEHDDLPDEEPIQQTSLKSTKRGVKRSRTHDGATGNEGIRKSKRLRLHLTDSSLQPQQHD